MSVDYSRLKGDSGTEGVKVLPPSETWYALLRCNGYLLLSLGEHPLYVIYFFAIVVNKMKFCK